MFETVKEVDEDEIINDHITFLSRDNITSLQVDNVEDIGKANDLLMIGTGVTKTLKN